MHSSRDIHNEVGGELQTYLPEKTGEIVAGRFGMQMNPNAPEEIYVGDLPRVKDKAIMLSKQATPIPVFIKEQEVGQRVQVCGSLESCRVAQRSSVLDGARQRSGRNSLAYVLRLERVGV